VRKVCRHHHIQRCSSKSNRPASRHYLLIQVLVKHITLSGSWSNTSHHPAPGQTRHDTAACLQVNASLLRRINATPGLFLCHVSSPAALQAATGQQAAYQGVQCLQAAFTAAAAAADAEGQWQALLQAVDGVLRKAYQHVHSCKCDVVMGLQLQAEDSRRK
jgi:hypothetical protein